MGDASTRQRNRELDDLLDKVSQLVPKRARESVGQWRHRMFEVVQLFRGFEFARDFANYAWRRDER